MPAERRWRHLAVSALTVFVVLGPACAADQGTGTTPAPGSQLGAGDSQAPSAAPSFADIASLRDALESGGVTCTLEYESLTDAGKELSLCVIDGDRATLTIWQDPSVLEEFRTSAASGPGVVVAGRNWTIDLQHVTVAGRVAAILHGDVIGG